MTDEPLKPKTGRSRKPRKPGGAPGEHAESGHSAAAPRPNVNPIGVDETYSGLRDDNRVVMRHQIALNLDSFRAAPQDFAARPARSYAPLQATAAPFLSIIIPTYNGLAHLQTVLPALAAQDFGDFEVIVVDDASTDESVAWLEANYPEVRLLVNRQNRGFVAACNAAADAARGRVLVFLNNDTAPEPGWTRALAQAVCYKPRAGIFASKLLLFDRREVLHSAGDLLGVDGVPRNRGVWQTDTGQYDAAPAVFGGCGGAVAYRRELWTALGGFDESFWMYLEDADFAFRAQLLGWDAVFVPEARVYHRLSATGGGALASYYVGRNTIWLIAKNMPRGLLLRHLPQVLAAQARIALDAVRHWRGAAARARLAGQLAGMAGIGTALRCRRQIQPRRVRDDRELEARLIG